MERPRVSGRFPYQADWGDSRSRRLMEDTMGELTDKIKGNVDEAVGKVKQAIGGHQGDAAMHDEGAAQEAKGKGEQFKGKVKGALGDDI
jgi:uncharacterized protein YjbJ (UPF0337 family)